MAKRDRFDRFADWLEREEYADSTIAVTVKDTRQACGLVEEGQPLPWRLRDRVRRALAWPRAPWTEEERAAFQELADQAPPKRQIRKRAAQDRKKRREISMSDPDWRRFVALLHQSDDPRDAVLYVMSQTALRVGDVLRLTRQRITGGLQSGRIRLVQKGGGERILPVDGAPAAWAKLADAVVGYETMAYAVSPRGNGSAMGSDAAYQAVARRLKAIGKELGVKGKMHTHRLRRTVAIQTLRVTGSQDMARRMLGSSSLGAVQPYIDEARPEELAEAQRKMAERFGPEPDGETK